ncbi:SDR family NAD(P)-dependent oxidoreductase [uncultured Sphingomonas sp.]|uniref:SDR family NAD(P)-dependent oxidoreductase n=1 Tax=uncultured Sphingomonas sp. TaxID=158754 RepID=UPI00260A33CB|nr:SDR family NAD(P)-dependent oxidoreductase [uncultured Sphingomonas sp.]
MSSLAGRVALVTGGGRGIGRAIALRLARDGADVAVNYRRDADAAAEVVREIEAMGRTAKAYAASVDRFEECATLVAAVLADFPAIDILVNNAGIASRGQPVADTDPGELERVLRTHAFAPHYMAKLVLPTMRARPRGDIIMISSVATLYNAANGAPYNMGKAAVEALAQTLAKEERKHGIRTNIVAPGLTVTDMGERLAKATRGVASIHDLDAQSPFGRVSTPEDVAAAVAYFVSTDGEYANGQKINLHGGG